MTKISEYINGLTEDTTPDKANDMLMSYDASASATKKVKMVNIGGTGDASGPASSTDGHLAKFDGTSGKLLKDGGAAPTTISRLTGTIVYDSGALGVAAAFDTGVISLTGYAYATIDLIDARAQASISNGDIRISFNADTTQTNYSSTSGGTTSYNNANCRNVGNVGGASATANLVTGLAMKLPNPAGANKKVIWCDGLEPENTSTANRRQYAVTWHVTDAITRIQIDVSNATTTFAAGSRMLVVGWKAENILTP